MKIEIFIAVRGGMIQGVRCGIHRSGGGLRTITKCFVVDYDNYARDVADEYDSEEAFESILLNGKTWAEIEKTSRGVY